MKPSEIIQGALDILDTPEKWCQGTLARDAKGDETFYFAETARQFCLDGAMLRASGAERLNIMPRPSTHLLGRPVVDPWRDERMVAMQALDDAVAALGYAFEIEYPMANNYVGFNDTAATSHGDIVQICKWAKYDLEERGL